MRANPYTQASSDPVGNLPRAPKSVAVPNDFGIGRCHCNGEMPILLLVHAWRLTMRPASLLCRFIAERASGRFSLASANSLETRTPNSASSLQPPHFQPSPGGPLWCESQPHMVDVPSAQERVTANATPAEAMAWTNADSRVAEGGRWKESRRKRGTCQTLAL